MAAIPPPNIKPMSHAEARAFLCGPGGRFELATATIRGEVYRVWKSPPAPANGRQVWVDAVKEYADREYIVYSRKETGETVRLTYGQADVLVKKLIGVLMGSFGVKKGTHVAIAMRNYPEYMITQWACMAIGAVLVNINAFLTPADMEYCILDGKSTVLVCDGERYEKLRTLPGLKNMPFIVCRREGRALAGPSAEFEKLVAEYKGKLEIPTYPIASEDNCIIFFTSGTTGKPKGALHTQRSFIGGTQSGRYGACNALLRLGYGPGSPLWPNFDKRDAQTVNLSPTPLFHVTANTATGVIYTSLGSKIIYMYKWDPLHAIELIQAEKVTGMVGVPSMHIQVLEHQDVAKYDLSSLLTFSSGGAPAPVSFSKQVKEKFATKQGANGWGMSETLVGVIGIGGEDYLRKPNSVGVPLPVIDVKYIDDDGKEVPVGQVGELCVRGPQILKEYFEKKEATEKTFAPGGWLKTGDLGKCDEEGFHYIVDRAKDILIRGGENISSVEVEDVLYTHNSVMDCAVVGLAHRILGEEVSAVVQLKPTYKNQGITAQTLIDHCKSKLPAFKVPVFITFRDEPLPRNPNGKILKIDLRKEVNDEAKKLGVAKL